MLIGQSGTVKGRGKFPTVEIEGHFKTHGQNKRASIRTCFSLVSQVQCVNNAPKLANKKCRFLQRRF